MSEPEPETFVIPFRIVLTRYIAEVLKLGIIVGGVVWCVSFAVPLSEQLSGETTVVEVDAVLSLGITASITWGAAATIAWRRSASRRKTLVADVSAAKLEARKARERAAELESRQPSLSDQEEGG